ncbi:MAG: RidA family protein [Dehalococcoidia bacterium]|jgi:enamine deaminase RidA (YjgF/YER057c/UK114 family)|nr:RidA family protein [Dehalococcoidia bacterium]MDP6226083.1 RidA family protein [Dehalococcoidia bacterium]MDP7083056.1 RidA family protein [Dehalococcoidia bacterium]MDP7200471.1 RidA family protein [Dehalococcoidia bacterium]MDP7510813.1 RidA family protein [Dehalococcoidia bacterium]
MRIEQKIADMGLELAAPSAPIANFVPTVRTGNLLFVSGHIPRLPDGSVLHPGKVGRELSVQQGYEAAKLAMVNCLASIKAALGDLDKVRQVVKLLVMVNASSEFDRQFLVGNGASDLLVELYGDQGRHARSAVGMGSLPRGACVEIEMIVEVAD